MAMSKVQFEAQYCRHHPSDEEFANERKREASFKHWKSPVPAYQLYPAGFHATGDGDSVQCFKCKLVLRDLKEGDDPFKLHIEKRPDCGFIPHMSTIYARRDSDTEHDGVSLDEESSGGGGSEMARPAVGVSLAEEASGRSRSEMAGSAVEVSLAEEASGRGGSEMAGPAVEVSLAEEAGGGGGSEMAWPAVERQRQAVLNNTANIAKESCQGLYSEENISVAVQVYKGRNGGREDFKAADLAEIMNEMEDSAVAGGHLPEDEEATGASSLPGLQKNGLTGNKS